MKHLQKVNKNVNLLFLINPTEWKDFDIIAVGSYELLKQLSRKRKYFYLVKRSKFGGIPILVMDTTDTLRGALSCIKEYKKEYATKSR